MEKVLRFRRQNWLKLQLRSDRNSFNSQCVALTLLSCRCVSDVVRGMRSNLFLVKNSRSKRIYFVFLLRMMSLLINVWWCNMCSIKSKVMLRWSVWRCVRMWDLFVWGLLLWQVLTSVNRCASVLLAFMALLMIQKRKRIPSLIKQKLHPEQERRRHKWQVYLASMLSIGEWSVDW